LPADPKADDSDKGSMKDAAIGSEMKNFGLIIPKMVIKPKFFG